MTFNPIGAEEVAAGLRGADLDSCVSCASERDVRGHVGGGVEKGAAGRGGRRWFASGRGAVRREKELGMRRSRSGLALIALTTDLSGLLGLAVRSMLARFGVDLGAARAGVWVGVGRGRRVGGEVASVAEGARMAGRDGAGACTMSGDWRGGGGIDSGRVRGVGRGRRDGPAMWTLAAGANGGETSAR